MHKPMADAICTKISEGSSLRKACADLRPDGPAAPTFLGWCDADPALAERYARARATGADAEFEALAELEAMEPERDDKGRIDPGFVAWKRLQVDTRKWALSKKAPRKYGDKLELSGDADNPIRQITRVENVVIDPKG